MNKDAFVLLPTFIRDPNPEIYLSDNYAVIDFETTNLDKGSFHNKENHVVSVSIFDNSTGTYETEMCNEFEVQDVIGDLSRFDYWVAHNSSFEWGWLWRSGYDFGSSLSACTQLAEYTIAGNRPFGRYASLDDCLKRRKLKSKDAGVSRMIKAGVNPSCIPSKYLLQYNEVDVQVENTLWRHQRQQLVDAGLLPAFFTKNLYTPVLTDIERFGLHLDKDRVTIVYEKQCARLTELELEWDDLTGGVNVKSGKQKAELFYEKLGFKIPKDSLTEKGAPKTDVATLHKLVPKTPEQKRVLELVRETTKIRDNLSKILDKFYLCCEENNGDLQFKINQTTTSTHRLSSTGQKYKTQGQNIHRSFKPLICARNEGWKLAEIDQDGLEFRMAGHLGRDEEIRRFIMNGEDPHELSGQIIFKRKWRFDEDSKSTYNKPLRQDAKAYTFKPLYGGRKGTAEEMEYFEEFRKKYPGISQKQERWVDEVIAKGYLTNETGLRFYWPGTQRYSNGSATNFQAICNYPVQYFATGDSGVVPIAVIYQWHMMKIYNLESFISNTIHDSSIGEVHPNELELYKLIAEWAFGEAVYKYLKRVYDIELFVPLSAKVEYHDYWTDSDSWRNQWLQ